MEYNEMVHGEHGKNVGNISDESTHVLSQHATECHRQSYGWSGQPQSDTSTMFSSIDSMVYNVLCQCQKQDGWSFKATSGTITMRNFIKSLTLEDRYGNYLHVQYKGLNVEAFNTLKIKTESFDVSINVRKDSTMHKFMVDFFRKFCHKGGVV